MSLLVNQARSSELDLCRLDLADELPKLKLAGRDVKVGKSSQKVATLSTVNIMYFPE